MSGVERRLARLLPGGFGLWLPVDDSLISGPDGRLRDMAGLLGAAAARVDGVLAFRGTLVSHVRELSGTATIENLTASTVGYWHTTKVQVAKVADAVSHGADAVAVHLNFTDENQLEMLRTIGKVRRECDQLGMPLVLIVYPRTVRSPGVDENYEALRRDEPERYAQLVAHAVRLGAEVGADIIKTQFIPDRNLMRSIVRSSLGRPVLIAGGPIGSPPNAELAHQALTAGARGVAFGRRLFQAENLASELDKLHTVLAAARAGDY